MPDSMDDAEPGRYPYIGELATTPTGVLGQLAAHETLLGLLASAGAIDEEVSPKIHQLLQSGPLHGREGPPAEFLAAFRGTINRVMLNADTFRHDRILATEAKPPNSHT